MGKGSLVASGIFITCTRTRTCSLAGIAFKYSFIILLVALFYLIRDARLLDDHPNMSLQLSTLVMVRQAQPYILCRTCVAAVINDKKYAK